MINVSCEQLLTLAQAARLRPPGRAGRPTSPSTLYRWATHGIRGFRLEAVRFGSVWYTSVEAMQRFVNQLSSQASASAAPTPPATAPAALADARLDTLGL